MGATHVVVVPALDSLDQSEGLDDLAITLKVLLLHVIEQLSASHVQDLQTTGSALVLLVLLQVGLELLNASRQRNDCIESGVMNKQRKE